MATQATHWITAGLVAGSLWAGGAQATLIENGGFENALLDPWTCFAPTAFDRLCQPIDDPRTGAQALLAYHNAGGGILEQVIPTVPGASYDFSAWSKTLLDLPENVLRYSLDGAPFVEVPRTTAFAPMADSFTAQGAQTPIRFFFQTAEGAGSWRLDDVIVTLRSLPATPEAVIPAPPAAPLLAAALAGLWALRRRRS